LLKKRAIPPQKTYFLRYNVNNFDKLITPNQIYKRNFYTCIVSLLCPVFVPISFDIRHDTFTRVYFQIRIHVSKRIRYIIQLILIVPSTMDSYNFCTSSWCLLRAKFLFPKGVRDFVVQGKSL